MTKILNQPLKGMTDDFPEKLEIYNFIKKTIEITTAHLGYKEYDAPVLEPIEVYLKKTSAELLQEQSYVFKDRGERTVLLRPEMTPSMARMISQIIKSVSLPIRWYSFPKCYRYERPQKGRLREFRQFNLDIIGGEKLSTDSEIVFFIFNLMKSFQIKKEDYTFFYNHRGWINFLLEREKFDKEEIKNFYYAVDRKNKLSEEKFEELLLNTFTNKDSSKKIDFIHRYLNSVSPLDLLSLEDISHDDDLKSFYQFITIVEEQGWSNVKFAPHIVRGIDYYTGLVFEIFGHSKNINRALFGGGRYDNLLSNYGKESVSGVGFGMGMYIFSLFLEELGLIPSSASQDDETSVYIAPLAKEYISFAFKIAQSLMQKHTIELANPSSLNAHFKKIKQKNNSFMVVVGEEEKKGEFFKLKNLKTSEIDTIFLKKS